MGDDIKKDRLNGGSARRSVVAKVVELLKKGAAYAAVEALLEHGAPDEWAAFRAAQVAVWAVEEAEEEKDFDDTINSAEGALVDAVDNESSLAKVNAAMSVYQSSRDALLKALRTAANDAQTAAHEKLAAAEPSMYAVYTALVTGSAGGETEHKGDNGDADE